MSEENFDSAMVNRIAAAVVTRMDRFLQAAALDASASPTSSRGLAEVGRHLNTGTGSTDRPAGSNHGGASPYPTSSTATASISSPASTTSPGILVSSIV